MRVEHDAALLALPVNVRQLCAGNLPALQDIPQHVAGADGRQLIRVAHQNQPGSGDSARSSACISVRSIMEASSAITQSAFSGSSSSREKTPSSPL